VVQVELLQISGHGLLYCKDILLFGFQLTDLCIYLRFHLIDQSATLVDVTGQLLVHFSHAGLDRLEQIILCYVEVVSKLLRQRN
jgi:hypothetical protein